MKNKNAGFTLMELMVAIGIFAILAAIVTPNVIQWMRNAQLNSTVRGIKSTIEDMRLFAVKNNAVATVTFTDNASSFQTDKWRRGQDDHLIQTHDMAGTVSISSNFTGDQLVYNNRGFVNQGGTITIQSAQGSCQEIVVALSGTTRIDNCP